MHTGRTRGLLALLIAPAALWLHGCGSSEDPNDEQHEDHPDKPAQGDWKLPPLAVIGQHIYEVDTKKPFYPRGIGFPNCGEDIEEWLKVLDRLKKESPSLNVVRIYELPSCAMKAEEQCFKKFMKKADDMGIYVLAPGTNTDWGYLPIEPALFSDDPQKAYEMGGVLGWGQSIIRFFNYPNTLAIVVGNEFDQKPEMRKHLGVIKAYTRDLRKHLDMCNSDSESPTKGQMREIPLMYASSDDGGDAMVKPKMQYLYCDDKRGAVDMFGLNLERWCSETTGPKEYKAVNDYVQAGKYPGAFFISEDGCTKTVVDGGVRTWTQTLGFFKKFPAFSGYAAYVYNGNPDFDMFDKPTADATMNADGQHFFKNLNADAADPSNSPTFHEETAETPQCPTEIPFLDWTKIASYETGEAGWAKNCPVPYSNVATGSEVVI